MVAVHVDCGNQPIVDRVDARTWKFHFNSALLSAPTHHVRDYGSFSPASMSSSGSTLKSCQTASISPTKRL